jgi:excisionase family DNA binding protein
MESVIDPWLSTSEVAKILSTSQKTVRLLISENCLPAFRPNPAGRLKIRKSALVAYMKKPTWHHRIPKGDPK